MKSLKIRKKQSSKEVDPMKKRLKGFTLAEVMVSLVILTIVVTISSTMIISSLNLLLKNAFIRDAQNNGNEIYQLLEDKLRYSQHFRIISDEGHR
jgi:prepilin-type N-terminal cleavage/methylation domain-containing protein